MPRSLNIAKLSDSIAAQGLSQTALAEKLGVTRAAVSKWFKGESFPLDKPPDQWAVGSLAGGKKDCLGNRHWAWRFVSIVSEPPPRQVATHCVR